MDDHTDGHRMDVKASGEGAHQTAPTSSSAPRSRSTGVRARAAYRRLRSVVKLILACGLHYSGLLSLICRYRLRGRAVVLMYHRVLPAGSWTRSFSTDAIIVTPDTFAKHLRFLRKHFRPLGLDAFLAHLADRRRFPPRACLLTFDDGWRDNYEHAFPLLRRSAVPAAIFLPTAFIGSGRRFWQERLSHLLYSMVPDATLRSEPALQALDLERLQESGDDAAKAYVVEFVRTLKHLERARIDAVLDTFDRAMPQSCSGLAAHVDMHLDWGQVREMQAAGIAFGSHSVSHSILPRLTREEMQRELEDSLHLIADATGARVDTLAYPNGDWDDVTRELAGAAGY